MPDVLAVAEASLAGLALRWYWLRVDYRQYPSYPQGYAVHLSLGLIAAFLGALAVPALLAREFAAASFLALAATQFREVRKIEREALANLEETELIRRGAAYIEGIARVFEARNYVAMLTGLLCSAVLALGRPPVILSLPVAAAVAVLVGVVIGRASAGLKVGQIARITRVPLAFDGPLLTIEGAVLMNVGHPASRQIYLEHGVGIRIEPTSPAAALTLANPGQRQAILHDLVAQVGARMDVDEPEFAPLARRHVASGSVVIALVPEQGEFQQIREAVARVPVLEGSVRLPGSPEPRDPVPGPAGVPRHLDPQVAAPPGGHNPRG